MGVTWYPIVCALVVTVFVHTLAVRMTDDRRVHLTPAVLLAVVPVFA